MMKPTRLTLDLRTNHTICQAMKWLLLVITLGNGAMQGKAKTQVPDLGVASSNYSSESGNVDHSRPCTADELLPLSKHGAEGQAVEWAPHDMVEPRYGCNCPFYRARYYCPDVGVGGSFKWVPRVVADGICQEKTLAQLESAPLPPDFRILVYGNSHLRQVVEGIMCMFQQSIERKRVTINDQDVMVPGDTQCRICTDTLFKKLLKGHNCLPVDVDYMCSDNHGEFYFTNGAMIHYVFAHHEKGKQIESSLLSHNTSISYYDVVVANSGNGPYLHQSSLLQSAAKMQNEGVPLIWLSEYDGVGDISGWEADEKTQLADTGTMFLPVHYMVRGLTRWTKGFVIDGVVDGDPHYCLPGPPDQIGLLLLRILWALYDEWGGMSHTVGADAAP